MWARVERRRERIRAQVAAGPQRHAPGADLGAGDRAGPDPAGLALPDLLRLTLLSASGRSVCCRCATASAVPSSRPATRPADCEEGIDGTHREYRGGGHHRRDHRRDQLTAANESLLDLAGRSVAVPAPPAHAWPRRERRSRLWTRARRSPPRPSTSEQRIRHVIHTVGPVLGRQPTSARPSCWPPAIGAHWRPPTGSGRTVAFPALATWVYGFPAEQAAAITLRTIR